MIRFDGYYISRPVLWEKRRDEEKDWFYIKALLFLKNGEIIITSKYVGDKNDDKFLKKEFIEGSSYKYYCNGDEFFIVDKEGYRFYRKIISPEKIVYRDSDEIMKFVPWEEDKSL